MLVAPQGGALCFAAGVMQAHRPIAGIVALLAATGRRNWREES